MLRNRQTAAVSIVLLLSLLIIIVPFAMAHIEEGKQPEAGAAETGGIIVAKYVDEEPEENGFLEEHEWEEIDWRTLVLDDKELRIKALSNKDFIFLLVSWNDPSRTTTEPADGLALEFEIENGTSDIWIWQANLPTETTSSQRVTSFVSDGNWSEGKWLVQIRRPLVAGGDSVRFDIGGEVHTRFQVFDGGEGQTFGANNFSEEYEIILATPETSYDQVTPLVFLGLIVAGVSALVVIEFRKRGA